MKKFLGALLLASSLSLAALPALADVPAVAGYTQDASQLQSGSYTLEPMHTRVLFSINHMGFTNYFGEFTGPTGTLTLNAQNPAASQLTVKIPVASLTTSNSRLDNELQSPQWFDTAAYPDLIFKSTSVTVTGRGEGKVAGNLTMHGVTKPVTLNVKFNGAGINPLSRKYTAGFEVSGQIKRSDFGISAYLPLIGDDVTLIISSAFEKDASAPAQ